MMVNSISPSARLHNSRRCFRIRDLIGAMSMIAG